MNHPTSSSISAADAEQAFGRRVAARLSAGNLELQHDLAERLRASRVQALAKRKVQPQYASTPVVVSKGSVAVLGGGWWSRVGAIVPLIALVAGLVAIGTIQDDNRADELAEVDSALLTSELPPAAYTDPGFAQFLKSNGSAER